MNMFHNSSKVVDYQTNFFHHLDLTENCISKHENGKEEDHIKMARKFMSWKLSNKNTP
jgi:hypothetical protein